ncbi:hypothetical protein HUU42_09065 [bacterium]|nr:hypothetical protein [bacterium]
MKIITVSFLFLAVISLQAQQNDYYFYKPENNFGSDLFFNPGSLILNGSYDILRNGAHSKDISDIAYRDGIKGVWKNISHPIKHINRYGWGNFWEREFFNFTLKPKSMQFAPNLMNHTIGNGMQYVKLAEWYDYHQVPFPYVWSFLTTTTYQFMNEVNENGAYQGTNVDPISDMLIFNPLGFLLFSSHRVRYFFSHTLPLYDWSLQPVYNPSNHYMENAGQQFAIKKPFTSESRYGAFIYWGIHALGGLTYTPDRLHSFSVGAGVVVNKLNVRGTEQARYITPNLDGAIGFFYDKNHSLMTSLILQGPKYYTAQLNVYPAVIRPKRFAPGLYTSYDESRRFVFGLTLAYLPAGLFMQN